MTEPNGDLTSREREALQRLPREAAPPPELEELTVSALVARGSLRRRASRRLRLREALTAAAAGLLLIVTGWVVGARRDVAPSDPRPLFALLLYEGPEYRHAPGEGESDRVREYSEWAGERAARGELVAGEKLSEDPDLVVRADGVVDTLVPSPTAPRLAGFFVIRASGRPEALALARSCPHVRYGGSVVIRRIDPT